MKWWFALVVIAAVGAVAFWMTQETNVNDESHEMERVIPGTDLYFAPESVSQARAERVSPSGGSEDVSGLLKLPAIEEPESPVESEEKEYLPEPRIHWLVDVEPTEKTHWSKEEVERAFPRDWLKAEGFPELYGRQASNGKWTYADAGDVEGPFTQLRLAVKLCVAWDDPITVSTEADLQRFGESVRRAAAALGSVKVRSLTTAAEGAASATKLAALAVECKVHAIIVLQAPRGERFVGRDVWDVMLCLGLRWGDMDLFHLRNESEIGDDAFFSVWTSSPPGYFLPEAVEAGEMNPVDLVFGFSIPRTADSEMVAKAMAEAARYAQKRLGGRLLDAEDGPFDEEAMLGEVSGVVSKLKSADIEPGHSTALQLF